MTLSRLRNVRRDGEPRGVAILIVLMIILGLMILGQGAILALDQVALRSGTYRRQEVGNYCAEEGLNLGRAWLVYAMGGKSQLDTRVLNHCAAGCAKLFADPTNPTNVAPGLSAITQDLCQIATLPAPYAGINGLLGLCRQDALGHNLYQINLIDDIDEAPGTTADPFTDANGVFILRAECTTTTAVVSPGGGGVTTTSKPLEDVAMVEINQAASGGCYGLSGGANPAGCGGGYSN